MQNRRTMIGLGIGAGLALASAQAAAQTQTKASAPTGTQPRLRGAAVTMIATPNGPGLAVRTPRGVFDVAGFERATHRGLPTTVSEVINQQGNITDLQALLADPSKVPERWLIPEGDVKFANMLTHPPKIICVGLNYKAHAAEGGAKPPTEPILFNKFSTAINHHRNTIKVTGEPEKEWDYEAELVAVMGQGGRNISEAQALSTVFGYANGNDFSNRNLQNRSAQWMLGKTTDGSGPFGPWLVTADQVDPNNLDMKLTVNGEIRQSTNTSKMIFSCAQIVAYCSKYFTLEPGDVIFTGTCEGVILGMPKDKQVWLKAGDKMAVSITGLGVLENALV